MPGLFDRLQEDLDQREKMEGMSPADLLLMPDDEVAVVQLLVRRGDMSLDALVAALNRPEEDVILTLERLREKGFARPIELKEGTVYRTYFARKRQGLGSGSGSAMASIWDQLGEKLDEKVDETVGESVDGGAKDTRGKTEKADEASEYESDHDSDLEPDGDLDIDSDPDSDLGRDADADPDPGQHRGSPE